MRKFFEIGGVVAAAVLVAFGIAAIVMGANGRSTVNSSLKQEYLVGTPDMTPAAIAAEAKKAGLPAGITLPTTSVAGKVIDTGSEARAFAQYMRIHALEATGGFTYAQMGRYTRKATAREATAAARLQDRFAYGRSALVWRAAATRPSPWSTSRSARSSSSSAQISVNACKQQNRSTQLRSG